MLSKMKLPNFKCVICISVAAGPPALIEIPSSDFISFTRFMLVYKTEKNINLLDSYTYVLFMT